jgi:predicted PurR-regulated permease PerM
VTLPDQTEPVQVGTGSEPVAPMSRRLGQLALVCALCVIGIWIVWDFLPALAWAVVVATALWPLTERVASQHPNRAGAALVFTFLIGAILVVPLILLGVALGREVVGLGQWLRTVEQEGIAAPVWLAHVPLIGASLADWWQSHLADPRAAADLLGRSDRSLLLEWARSLGLQLVHRLTILAVTLLTLFFLFRDGPLLLAQTQTVIDRVFGATGLQLGKQVVVSIRATVNGLVLVGFGEGLLLGIAYALCGVPRPVLLGALTGVLATIPFGAPAVYVIGALILFSQSQPGAAIALLVFGTLLVFVADHFVRPILIGGATRLPFLWVLLGIFGGLETFGLLGLFLGPAIMAALVTLWREWSSETRTGQHT